LLAAIAALAASLSATPSVDLVARPVSIPFSHWWRLEPGPLPEAIASASAPLAEADPLNVKRLHLGPHQTVRWSGGRDLSLQEVEAPRGKLTLPAGPVPSATYAATYLRTPRWLEGSLHTAGSPPYQVYLDGESLARVPSATADVSTPVILTQGLHQVVIKRLAIREASGSPSLKVALSLVAPCASASVTFPASSSHPLSIEQVRDWPSISDLALSPAGDRLAFAVTRVESDHHTAIRCLEVRNTRDGRLIETIHLGHWPGEPTWSHDGRLLAFTSPGQRGTDLWVYDLPERTYRRVAADGKGLRGLSFSPDDRLIYYQTTEIPSKENPLYERLEHLGDRRPGNHDRDRLHVAAVDGSWHQQLTSGKTNPGDWAVSPDGTQLAYVDGEETDTRPFERSSLFLLDLRTLQTHRVMALPSGTTQLAWDPDGKRLALLAYPGEVADGEPDHNRYQTLYMADLATHQVRRPFKDAPAIVSPLFWSRHDRSLYLLECMGSETALDRISFGPEGRVERLPVGCDDLRDLTLSEGGERLAAIGSGLADPDRIVTLSTHGGGGHTLLTPEADLADVAFGKDERWTFRNAQGDLIDGWLQFPPGFDSRKRYPLIVYYYGGAIPTARNFNRERTWFAAHGYVVYTLNPSGAYGYGLAFADRHVNDWGERVADEIVTGVTKLLAARPYLDPKRVGNYGGSYGGFMTLDLATKTDLFAASVDMYGISDIASYWGGGYWGYGYGDYALARSYPWNRPDIFMGRSPLYHADRIKTPLLLLHGTGDTNVPSLESDQMFTALKILGKDVAYVRFMGQDHGIRGTPAHRQAVDELMLEWFDRYLKGEPEAWNHRWSEEQP
jgi:dipeptidyl aminopeptidase/acylaminoacyl peptidase